MTIYVGADHGGATLKEVVKRELAERSLLVKDLSFPDASPDDDYPGIAFRVARQVVQDVDAIGLLFCRSGGGMAIAANRILGARAIQASDERSVLHARQHNNANILTIGADWVSTEMAVSLCLLFVATPFTREERHQRRIDQLDAL